MKNNDFGKKLIGTIKENELRPKPKWQFLFKNYTVWFVGVVSLVIGALAFSVVIYLINFSGWDAYQQTGDSWFKFVILTLPYFWLVLLAIFIYVVYYNIKHTKKGYRHSLLAIITASLIASFILGGIFFKVGFGQVIDDALGERAPFYSKVINRQVGFWSKAEQGRLIGVLMERIDDNTFNLIDPRGNVWEVEITDKKISQKINDSLGLPVRCLGKMKSENKFKANLAIPLQPGRKFIEKAHRDLRSKEIMDQCQLKFGKECDLRKKIR